VNTLHLPIPLPETWPRQTKSALVAATSLAHAALTFARGWCVNSPLERVRLAAECERLRSEVVLLREELRIKDARMHKLEPARRPQYAPVERLASLSRSSYP